MSNVPQDYMAHIKQFAAEKCGSITVVETEPVVAVTTVQAQCAAGHQWITIAANIHEWCDICAALFILHKRDINIVCSVNNYTMGQRKFTFVCKLGHEFTSDLAHYKMGCTSCSLLSSIRKKHNVCTVTLNSQSVNYGANSKLRFHCNRYRHNPQCTNPECIIITQKPGAHSRDYAENCVNLVPCGQDFYATPAQVKKEYIIVDCEKNHYWRSRCGTYTVLRALEAIFDARFDDQTVDFEFSALNFEIKIAAIHMGDNIVAKYLESAKKWCTANSIRLIVIDKQIQESSKVGVEIATQLLDFGLFTQHTVRTLTQQFRTKLHKMTASGIMFTTLG